MLVFNFERLDDFLPALKYRIQNEVYSEYIEPETSLGASSRNHKLILQFLGNPYKENTNLIALYQIKIQIKKKDEREKIIEKLKAAFEKTGAVKLIQGSITEIFQSIS